MLIKGVKSPLNFVFFFSLNFALLAGFFGIGANIRIGRKMSCLPYAGFSPNQPPGPIWSSSRNVSLFYFLFVVPFLSNFSLFSRPLIGPGIVAGSTRQQPVGRINQVADCGDRDEDKDEIPSYAVLQTALVKRFGVSRLPDFFIVKIISLLSNSGSHIL